MYESIHWSKIEGSDKSVDFAAYLDRWPEGSHRDKALARWAALAKAEGIRVDSPNQLARVDLREVADQDLAITNSHGLTVQTAPLQIAALPRIDYFDPGDYNVAVNCATRKEVTTIKSQTLSVTAVRPVRHNLVFSAKAGHRYVFVRNEAYDLAIMDGDQIIASVGD